MGSNNGAYTVEGNLYDMLEALRTRGDMPHAYINPVGYVPGHTIQITFERSPDAPEWSLDLLFDPQHRVLEDAADELRALGNLASALQAAVVLGHEMEAMTPAFERAYVEHENRRSEDWR